MLKNPNSSKSYCSPQTSHTHPSLLSCCCYVASSRVFLFCHNSHLTGWLAANLLLMHYIHLTAIKVSFNKVWGYITSFFKHFQWFSIAQWTKSIFSKQCVRFSLTLTWPSLKLPFIHLFTHSTNIYWALTIFFQTSLWIQKT